MSARVTTFPPIEELVPHAEPMILLDEMTTWAPGEASCRMRVREGSPFVVDGCMQAVATIEPMAQAVAACLGYEALLGGAGVRVGMIIAAKQVELFGAQLEVGDDVQISVRRLRGNETLSHFDCTLARAGATFATAVLTLYHGEPPDGVPAEATLTR